MIIDKLIIKNFKIFEDFRIHFNEDINIIIGNNEAGKSTILEAINLVLTSQINGKYALNELTPHMFNSNVIKKYIKDLRAGKKPYPPEICIEVYFKDSDDVVTFKGENNSLREDSSGIKIVIKFDNEYFNDYNSYIESPDKVETVPSEFYQIEWLGFSNEHIKASLLPGKILFINNTDLKNYNGQDKYIVSVVDDSLTKEEKAKLSLNFRKMKESFTNEDSIKKVNEHISSIKKKITDKDVRLSLDFSSKTNWDNNLTLYIDDLPFSNIGKGEQNSIKLKYALSSKIEKSHIIMIEEPENNLSYTNMSKLVDIIVNHCEGKQLFICTHSSFIMNKSGIDKAILLHNKKTVTMNDISQETKNFFKKLPGYDTLRLILSQKAILVEGPSDELIVQKAYLNIHKKLPIQDCVDVISVGLSFLRFLEIAKMINLNVCVVTDNDGNVDVLKEKYKDYLGVSDNIKIYYSDNINLHTLECHFVELNSLDVLNKVFNKDYSTKQEMLKYMLDNKTDCALKVFETTCDNIKMPEYINESIK